jgi:hypothetical protein
MTEQELIQKIKQLKNIQPSQEWLDLMRQNLINQINLRPQEPRIGLFNWLLGGRLQSIALTICLLIILIGGPWLIVKASQASLPGEALYPIKKITEKAQAQLAPEENKVQLQVEFAARRLEELRKITEDSFSPEEKTEKVEQVVSDFKNNLAGASLHVKKIPKEKAVVIAKKTKKLKENLNKTKEEVSSVVQADLTEAEKVIEEINHQILTVLVGADGEETDETATTTDEEILILLKETESGSVTTSKEIINGIEK